jgi:prepilin-type N-terminal cleavage/methylation domain-containing protein
MKSEKGFSLVELLVVVIIIAIVAAIAIPNLLSSRRAANEASAISSLRTIHSAQATFQATLGGNVAYSTALTGAGSLNAASLIDSALGSGSKSGYSFVLTTNTGDTPANTKYCAGAKAQTQDSSGVRSFGVSSDGVIYAWADAAGYAACADGVLDTSAATGPIQ